MPGASVVTDCLVRASAGLPCSRAAARSDSKSTLLAVNPGVASLARLLAVTRWRSATPERPRSIAAVTLSVKRVTRHLLTRDEGKKKSVLRSSLNADVEGTSVRLSGLLSGAREPL